MSDSQLTVAQRWSAGAIFKGAFTGAAAGLVGNLALYFIASAAGVAMTARFNPSAPPASLALVAVVMSSLVSAIPASLVALAIARFAKDPAKVFGIVAGVFALLSMGGPANLAEAGGGLKLVLALMHVFSGAGITLGILRSTK
ncbi:MAG: DUF6069 family protein [Polyangiales bacterium]